MFEVDFDTGRTDVNRVTRSVLDNQCSENANLYVCYRILNVASLAGAAPHLTRGPVYANYLDMANLRDNTLVIHVIEGEVRAATIISSHDSSCNILKAWLTEANMPAFKRTLTSFAI